MTIIMSTVTNEETSLAFYLKGAKLLDTATGTKWFQVDFQKWAKVTGIKTQGHADTDEYIEVFHIHYSTDGINFISYKENGNIRV